MPGLRPYLLLAIVGATVATLNAADARDIQPNEYPIAAAVRVLSFFNPTLGKGSITIIADDRAIIPSAKVAFIRVRDLPCTFEERDLSGPSAEIFRIDFSRLSSEYAANISSVQIYGRPGAICFKRLPLSEVTDDQVDFSDADCRLTIIGRGYKSEVVRGVQRSLRYIAANVCAPVTPAPY